MAFDALFVFAARATLAAATATVNGSTIDIKNGTGHKNLWAVVHYASDATLLTTGTTRVYWKVQHSSDDSTWYDLTSGEIDRTASLTDGLVTSGTVYIPFCTTRRYVRIQLTVSGTIDTSGFAWEAYGTGIRPF